MKKIVSTDNKIFKMCIQLETKKYRDKLGKYVIEGPNLIQEALTEEIPPEFLIIDEEALDNPEIKALCEMYEKSFLIWDADKILILESGLFRRLSQTESSQGIFGVVSKPFCTGEHFFSLRDGSNGNLIVLDRLQDPGNVGTVIRTADAANYSGVIVLKGTADIFAPKVVRACTGSLFRVPILFLDSPEQVISLLRKNGKRVISTGFETDKYYYETDLKRNIGLVIGNEGNGICDEFMSQSDEIIKIPMWGKVESLNAAAAAAILMYEAMRN